MPIAIASASPSFEDVLRELRIAQLPDRDHGHAVDGVLHRRGVRDLETRGDRGSPPWRCPRSRRRPHRAPRSLEGAGEGDRVLGVLQPPIVALIGAAESDDQRHVVRHRGPHGVEALERKAHPILQRSTVLVGALVGERREEAREQVAVRGVHLDHVEADPHRPSSRGGERLRTSSRSRLRPSRRGAMSS